MHRFRNKKVLSWRELRGSGQLNLLRANLCQKQRMLARLAAHLCDQVLPSDTQYCCQLLRRQLLRFGRELEALWFWLDHQTQLQRGLFPADYPRRKIPLN